MNEWNVVPELFLGPVGAGDVLGHAAGRRRCRRHRRRQ